MWQIKGVTDAATQCDVCGRTELRRVIHLVTEEGDELYAGTMCAARKVGVPARRMSAAVDTYLRGFAVAREGFRYHIRARMGVSLEDYLAEHPCRERSATFMYRRYMERQGFPVA